MYNYSKAPIKMIYVLSLVFIFLLRIVSVEVSSIISMRVLTFLEIAGLPDIPHRIRRYCFIVIDDFCFFQIFVRYVRC